MQHKECADLVKGDRIFYPEFGFVFDVVEIEHFEVENPNRYMEYIKFLRIHLDDGLDADFGSDTGSLAIQKDPTATVSVLDEGEEPPQAIWKNE